jgi:hypothetical protein
MTLRKNGPESNYFDQFIAKLGNPSGLDPHHLWTKSKCPAQLVYNKHSDKVSAQLEALQLVFANSKYKKDLFIYLFFSNVVQRDYNIKI